MSTLADRTIAALRSNHDVLSGVVRELSDKQLTGPSGATEWTVAQVLSHLGSGGEIALAGYRAAIDGTDAPADGFNQSVWDRWDAMTPQEQAAGYLDSNTRVVEALEALTSEQRESVQVKLGFLPAPLSLAAAAGMRLNEVAQHSWDVRVALDPTTGISEQDADVLAEHFGAELGFLLGFIGKADQVPEPAVVELAGSGYAIVIGDAVSIAPSDGVEATATFAGPREAAIRLLGGRLRPEVTPADVSVTGNVTLDDLRRVFPGF